MLSFNDISLPLMFLYAETHFRFFPLFPSLLYKREPEILFDVPHRLEPQIDLPVLLILNDIHLFPAEPEHVAITVSQPSSGIELFEFKDVVAFEIDHPLKKWQRSFIFTIPHHKLSPGKLFINAKVTMKSKKKKWIVYNDNFSSSSRRAFCCYNADNPLPGNEICTYGDVHVHSQYSQSHVEFGPPLNVIDRMAKCCGLSFVGITDHSYDLACKLDDYLTEDQSLKRWHHQREELSDPKKFSTILIQGEEVSCNNSNNKTIHLGVLGTDNFIPGSADGARKNIFFKEQLTIPQVVTAAVQQGGICFAAHPGSVGGLLQRILLHRGQWTEDDFTTPPTGFQILNNGTEGSSWKRGKSLWIKMLQKNIKLPLLAGNDAHGDFSRYRAIEKPFLAIHENFQRFMGYGKTGIYAKCSNQKDILDIIRAGKTFITTGPYISVNYSNDPDDVAIASYPHPKNSKSMVINTLSSPEFGKLKKISVFSGSTQHLSPERLVSITSFEKQSYEEHVTIDCSSLPPDSYLRAEVETHCNDGITRNGFTSACYF